MKESYGEGFANHTSLESCGNWSNVMAEALAEGSAGGLLSSEITSFWVPTTWSGGEGNTCCSVNAIYRNIVPEKPANKEVKAFAEQVEGRALTEGNTINTAEENGDVRSISIFTLYLRSDEQTSCLTKPA